MNQKTIKIDLEEYLLLREVYNGMIKNAKFIYLPDTQYKWDKVAYFTDDESFAKFMDSKFQKIYKEKEDESTHRIKWMNKYHEIEDKLKTIKKIPLLNKLIK